MARKVRDLAYCLGGGKTAELMHKSVLADFDMHPNSVLNKFGVSNAHNEFDRVEALNIVREDIPEMLPWVVSELCITTNHVYMGPSGHPTLIEKSAGGDQGDPIVGILFPLLYARPVVAALSATSADGAGARAYSYQDDLDMIHDPKDTIAISTAFEQECAKLKLRSNRAKESLTPGPGLNLANDLPASYTIESAPKVLKHGSTPLPVTPRPDSLPGSQLGASAPEVTKLIEQRAVFFKRMRELVTAGVTIQDALSLVKVRTAADFVFLARTVGIPMVDARRLDQALLDHVLAVLGDNSHSCAKWVFIPQAAGGFGFASVAAVAGAAAAASWYENLPRVAEKLGNNGPAEVLARSPWLTQIARHCDEEIRRITGDLGAMLGDHGKKITQQMLAAAIQRAEPQQYRGDPDA